MYIRKLISETTANYSFCPLIRLESDPPELEIKMI